MKNNWNERAVGEIVTIMPMASEVFRSVGIDFCCGGNQILETVIVEQELTAEEIYSALDKLAEHGQAASSEDVSKMEPHALAEYILTHHHAYLWENLPQIHALLLMVLKAHGQKNPELYDVYKVFSDLTRDIEPHLIREETELFPIITDNDEHKSNDRTALVHILEGEHANMGNLLKELRHVTNNYSLPSNACNTFNLLYQKLMELENDTMQHYHLENNVLFKKLV